jgi:hypothetical protein
MSKSDKSVNDSGSKSTVPLWKRVTEVSGLVAGLIGSVTAIVTSCYQLVAFVSPILERWLGSPPSDLVVSITPDLSSAQLYTRILAEAGVHAKSATLDQTDSLGAQPPGLIIIDGRLQGVKRLAGMLQQRSWARAQVIAMGGIGSAVITEIDPDTILADIEYERNDPVIFGAPELPSKLTAGLPTNQPFTVYSEIPQNNLANAAVYDHHSLATLGALGIVRRTSVSRFPCAGSYWPVVQQGRCVFWGYTDDPENLTEEGKRLLLNLVKYLQSEQTKSVQAETLELGKAPPLRYSDKLDCAGTAPVDEQAYPFVVDRPGVIRVQVHSKEPLALILNGPGRLNAYARQDAIDPEVAHAATQQEIDNGTKWKVSVKSFDMKPGSKIPYTITIDYPPPRQRHPFIWISLGPQDWRSSALSQSLASGA